VELGTLQVTYNGHPFNDFTVQRASTYIEQTDEHIAELTCARQLEHVACLCMTSCRFCRTWQRLSTAFTAAQSAAGSKSILLRV
jgi:ABC-type multidrug transport system ATPase subunit